MTTVHDPERKRALLMRLKRVEGQLRGIQRLLEADSDCEQVAQQMAAARKAAARPAMTSLVPLKGLFRYGACEYAMPHQHMAQRVSPLTLALKLLRASAWLKLNDSDIPSSKCCCVVARSQLMGREYVPMAGRHGGACATGSVVVAAEATA